MNATKGLSDMDANERLKVMRERAGTTRPVDWDAVRRATNVPVSERDDADWALVDAYAN